jgi:hypothetical protein
MVTCFLCLSLPFMTRSSFYYGTKESKITIILRLSVNVSHVEYKRNNENYMTVRGKGKVVPVLN